MTQTSSPAFRILGTTNDVTECEHCGRTELKGTIVLAPLDADGNAEADPVHYGAVCGARAAGWKTADLRKAASAADRAKVEAAWVERQRLADIESARLQALRYTEECPLGPTICGATRRDTATREHRSTVRPCLAHA
jgi:hypothetical protein